MSGCLLACGQQENREDGENPSRTRRCIRGRTSRAMKPVDLVCIAATVFNTLFSHIGSPIEIADEHGKV